MTPEIVRPALIVAAIGIATPIVLGTLAALSLMIGAAVYTWRGKR